ncbi:hypothetical protein [Desulfonatronospira sp. MSAO_Bac3]|uniref:hypothetical protein n=1 Tax=Desulfonatronospira sp. MSAO_Bac3 TaxID=2293857 RepID=UPI000FF16C10|nr:hypothetical protein [Desulfonatronospira sp. MSAO_Bac3]RQD76924.1 MAG: hypothetical protein D5S03_05380 [Desulfonatronospira sp. MSAO_Bac3]
MWIAVPVVAAALAGLLVFAAVHSNRRLYETTSHIYQQLAGPANGRVTQMPRVLGKMTALELPVHDGQAFLHILDKEVSFYVHSPELKNCMPLWINDNMRKTLGSCKSGDPDFDRVFSVYKGPDDREKLLEKFDRDCRLAMLQLKEQALKHARNIWVELIHVRPRDDIFIIRINNFLLTRRGMTRYPEDISVYRDLLDRSMQVYLAFRRSACTSGDSQGQQGRL